MKKTQFRAYIWQLVQMSAAVAWHHLCDNVD